jgi:hypothetical protein
MKVNNYKILLLLFLGFFFFANVVKAEVDIVDFSTSSGVMVNEGDVYSGVNTFFAGTYYDMEYEDNVTDRSYLVFDTSNLSISNINSVSLFLNVSDNILDFTDIEIYNSNFSVPLSFSNYNSLGDYQNNIIVSSLGLKHAELDKSIINLTGDTKLIIKSVNESLELTTAFENPFLYITYNGISENGEIDKNIVYSDIISVKTETEFLFNASDELLGYNVHYYHNPFNDFIFFVIIGVIILMIIKIYILMKKKK